MGWAAGHSVSLRERVSLNFMILCSIDLQRIRVSLDIQLPKGKDQVCLFSVWGNTWHNLVFKQYLFK